MAFSGAMLWWEEWQLRVLVLGSLGVQCYLSFFASARKKHIRPLYRFFIWLAYLAGDSLAIYGLATLFNRHGKVQQQHPVNGSRDLEVLWAPILLMHLGGQTNISAYNIEDNELWRRHILTSVSQVTVAIYVFCKSWPSSSFDKRLSATAVLLFIIGGLKCFDKPFALKRASFNTIVTTFIPAPMTTKITKTREVELEQYIQEARGFVQGNQDPPALGSDELLAHERQLSMPDKLFVDYAYLYHDRLAKLRLFWLLDKETAYKALRVGISHTFNLIYSKLSQSGDKNRATPNCANFCSGLLFFSNQLLLIMPISLFHASRREDYRGSDVKVTFVLLYITYFLEIWTFWGIMASHDDWSDGIAQHSLIGYLARSRRLTSTAYFSLKPCHSSKDIIMLVRGHVQAGWMNLITEAESYWRFTDTRGQWALERSTSEEILWSIDQKPFDESIILWHVVTDFCYFHRKDTSPNSEWASKCRLISNYMMHLLFANPEMLLPGSRRNLFTTAYKELETILRGADLSQLDEEGLTQKIIEKVYSAEDFIQDSWALAQQLMHILDENKMWEVIKGVWIEMLCFSAGRCRGYLHAKSLGSGGEYLTFVSLLMSHAGLETFAERQQRVQLRLPKEERVRIANHRIQEAACNKVHGGTSTPQGMAPVMTREESSATTSASQVKKPLKDEEEAAIKIAVLQ